MHQMWFSDCCCNVSTDHGFGIYLSCRVPHPQVKQTSYSSVLFDNLHPQDLPAMDFILQCLGHRSGTNRAVQLSDDNGDATDTANTFVNTIFLAEKTGAELKQSLADILDTNSWRQATWREKFAKAVFEATQKGIETARPMSAALREVYDKVACVVDGIEGFVKDHPIVCALIALGILVLLAPWVIEALGFAEGGILEGSFAAEWQSTYAGFVPKGSLFSLLQKLGMKGFV